MSKKIFRPLILLIPLVLGITMFFAFAQLSSVQAAPLMETHVSGTINADTTWTLGVRIDDRQTTPQNQQWFATGFMIFPGMNTIRMYIEDIGHKVDLRQIQRVQIFTNDLERDVDVYLDNVRFERAQVAQIIDGLLLV